MIILYESSERNFTTLGLGVLKDATFGAVVEELNGGFELELEYPVDGSHYADIGLQKILFTKPNAYDNAQPFRIYSISKPINGLVTINAEHISYDMAGYTIKPFSGTSLLDTISKIQNGSIRVNPFTLAANFDEAITMKTKSPYAMRSLLAGGGDSLVDIYGGYFKFDKFNVNLLSERGSDRGVALRYGKNLTELEQEINSEKMYTGIFPYYFALNTETRTFLERYHEKVFIVDGVIPFTSGWLALENEAFAFIPIVETIPVQVKTPGSYFDNVYWFKIQMATEVEIVGGTPFNSSWLSLTEGGAALIPEELTIYKVITAGDYEYTKYIWNGTEYIVYEGNGFYRVPDPIPPPILIKNTVETVETEDYRDITSATERYIITGKTEFEVDWLSDVDVNSITDAYIIDGSTALDTGWLSATIDGPPLVPENNKIYLIKTEGQYLDVKYAWSDVKSLYVATYGVEAAPAINNVYIVKTAGIYFDKKYKWDDLNSIYIDMEPEYYGDGIIYVDEAAEFQKILTLDLTAEFDRDAPTVQSLRAKAIEYLDKNDITEVVNSTTVSFIKLADSLEYERYSELETVELGDMVNVIYEELGVSSKLQVIRTEYNIITEKYNEIELGEKAKNIADNAMTFGDNVSALVNDERYTDQASVKIFIAETITAEYIQAKNANFSEAQINDLKVMKINASGIIEGSSIAIDKIVANLLIATDAEITNVLTAGEITVKGTIFADAGEIGGAVIEDGVLKVPAAQIEGQLEAAQIKVEDLIITNSININEVFTVDSLGNAIMTSILLSSSGNGSSVAVDSNGKLTAENADISGNITTEVINVSSIIFDNLVALEMSSYTTLVTTTYTVTAGYPVISYPGGGVANLTVRLTANAAAPINKSVSVTISYKYPFDTNTYTDTIYGTLLAGNTYVNLSESYPPNFDEQPIQNVTVISYFPSSFNVTTTVGVTALGVDSHFVPATDNTYDLGVSDLRWDDVWATNAAIQTSDRRNKKEINYDILAYDLLFDKLQPVSYKFKDGKKGRTHLGFIAQDIEASLEELGIDSNDFAGLIKDLGLKGRNKENPEDVTEDDYTYGIRYSELHAMEVKQIQDLKKRIEDLEKLIKGS